MTAPPTKRIEDAVVVVPDNATQALATRGDDLVKTNLPVAPLT